MSSGDDSKKKDKNGLPSILLCFRKPDKSSEKQKDTKTGDSQSKSKKGNTNVKRSKSRELRAGILYVGCDCERRNGLQDHCPRSDCQGAPECMTFPPTCPPSEFAQNKHNVKIYDQLVKERAAFARQLAEKQKNIGGGGERASDKSNKGPGNSGEKVDYDCYPLDELMKAGMPCPICDRPIDGCSDKKKPKDIVMGPIIIDFDVDCMCPGAS